MTWFWSNHFSVFGGKADLRAAVGDFEERAIRAHALGRFRDLLGAAARHPAMLRYLDNERNAAGRLNENFARELLELHTLGVDGGYAQADVQELARVLSGVGIAYQQGEPPMRTALRARYVREGAFEFNPARHDFGDKRVLGRTIAGRGLDELEEVLDLLAAHPSTARHVARRLAQFMVSDTPGDALVARLADAFSSSGGDVPAVLRVLFASPEFHASLGGKFKDPTRSSTSRSARAPPLRRSTRSRAPRARPSGTRCCCRPPSSCADEEAAMHRRTLLTAALAAPLAVGAPRLWAAPSADAPRLLLVFLRGGYDCASLLVPAASPFHAEARPTIAIARPGASADAALPLDADWALHPATHDSLHRLWLERQLAFVPFAGTADTSRSHFETQDGIELGLADGRGGDRRSGFLNRLAAAIGGGAAPIAFADRLPVAFRGELAVPNLAVRGGTPPGVADPRQRALLGAMYAGTALERPVADGFEVRDAAMRELAEPAAAAEQRATGRDTLAPGAFEQEARRIGRLMRERYALGMVDVGGWDTHVAQAAPLAARFGELGRGFVALADALGPAWARTLVVAISEFGRTFRENGNRGTDHGHGTAFVVLGGAVRGGRVAGEQVRVARETLHQDRDLPVLNEYRAVLGGLFARLHGLDAARLATVFPDVAPVDLGLV